MVSFEIEKRLWIPWKMGKFLAVTFKSLPFHSHDASLLWGLHKPKTEPITRGWGWTGKFGWRRTKFYLRNGECARERLKLHKTQIREYQHKIYFQDLKDLKIVNNFIIYFVLMCSSKHWRREKNEWEVRRARLAAWGRSGFLDVLECVGSLASFNSMNNCGQKNLLKKKLRRIFTLILLPEWWRDGNKVSRIEFRTKRNSHPLTSCSQARTKILEILLQLCVLSTPKARSRKAWK